MRDKYQRRRLARRRRDDGITITADPMAGREDAFYDPPILDMDEFKRSARKSELDELSVPNLREIAKARGVAFTTRTRKADLIDLIVGAP